MGLSRRDLLVGASALLVVGADPALAAGYSPDPRLLTRTPKILPRSQWAGSACPVRGPLPIERAGDVKLLLVHHTAEPGNSYTAADVPGLLRGMYRYHTGPDKKWPDIAYNFLVDKYGRIYEGRTGSLNHAVMPSATGGSQGFDQLGCFIGNHQSSAPTSQAQASMISLLAWLARCYRIQTAPGTTTTFISRGSNRYPKGQRITVRTIEGHRVVSTTSCPGDAAYPMVRNQFPGAVTKLNSG